MNSLRILKAKHEIVHAVSGMYLVVSGYNITLLPLLSASPTGGRVSAW